DDLTMLVIGITAEHWNVKAVSDLLCHILEFAEDNDLCVFLFRQDILNDAVSCSCLCARCNVTIMSERYQCIALCKPLTFLCHEQLRGLRIELCEVFGRNKFNRFFKIVDTCLVNLAT